MKSKRVQIILPEAAVEKFEKQAKKQGRSESNLGRKYLMEGLAKDDEKDKK
jgi:hypothetical protein